MLFVKKITVIILILSSGIIGCKKTQKSLSPIKVMTIVGQVSLKNSGRSLKANDIIKPGDSVVTGKNSFVELLVPIKSAIKIYENTEFTLAKYVRSGEASSVNTEYTIETGKSLFLIQKLIKGSSIRVRTPTSVASVRGTTFIVAYSRGKKGKMKGETELKVVDGKVLIQTEANPQENTVVESKQMLVVSDNGVIVKKKDISIVELNAMIEEKKKLHAQIVIKAEKIIINTDKVIISTDKKQTATTNKIPLLKTEKEIKQYYNKLEVVNLDDGTTLIGAVIFQNDKIMKIYTTHGIIKIPTVSVKNIQIR